MDCDEIRALLPHRHPFLMVDRMVELEPGKCGVGLKLVTGTEPWCAGHFPGRPIMPGVLITEALAQTCAVVFLSANDEMAGQEFYLVGVDRMRYRRMVRPGDALYLHVEVESERRRMWTFKVRAEVDGQKVANGTLLATA